MHDGIEFEKRGVPAAVIITDLFINSAKTVAKIAGIADYPYVVIPHPISRLSDQELRERAELATSKVIPYLTKS